MLSSLFARSRNVARRLLPATLHARVFHFLEDTPLFRRLHGEMKFIQAQLATLSPFAPWHAFDDTSRSAGMSERVVEIPWALSRYAGERRVLDIGACYALGVWTRHLTRRGIPELHGVDLAARPVEGMKVTQADVRAMPFDDGYFDLAFCVSTLEHVGEDNTNYSVAREAGGAGDDTRALQEIERVLRPGGRVLVSVPFGRADDLGWQRVYDLEAWESAVAATTFETAELAIYESSDAGWLRCEGDALPSRPYRDAGAPAATAVLCAVLRRPAQSGKEPMLNADKE